MQNRSDLAPNENSLPPDRQLVVHLRATSRQRVLMLMSIRIYVDEDILRLVLFGVLVGMSYAQFLNKLF